MESSYIKEMADTVSVVDVYDSAALIGKDFEYIIEQYGVEAVTDLMPKVIRVLEQLEYLATRQEHESDEIHELEATIRRLSIDKEERNKERQKYEQELEQIEDSWRKESKELSSQISRLQEKNKLLQNQLSSHSHGQQAAVEKCQEDSGIIESLRETVHTQRTQIKGLQRDVKHKQQDVDNLRTQADELERQNKHLQNNSSQFHSQTKQLLTEHIQLQSTIQEKENQIKHFINIQEKQKTDESEMMERIVTQRHEHDVPKFTLNELKDILMERNTLKSRLIETGEELSYYKNKAQPEVTNPLSDDVSEGACSNDEDNYIGPVQGPINREPWDKLHGDGQTRESGIRKFFKLLGFTNEQPRSEYQIRTPKK